MKRTSKLNNIHFCLHYTKSCSFPERASSKTKTIRSIDMITPHTQPQIQWAYRFTSATLTITMLVPSGTFCCSTTPIVLTNQHQCTDFAALSHAKVHQLPLSSAGSISTSTKHQQQQAVDWFRHSKVYRGLNRCSYTDSGVIS
jgi:hypothetical protein